MKKTLFIIGGIGVVGYSFYYFFKKQLDLALDFEYKLRSFKVDSITTQSAVVDYVVEIKNKSSFKITINSYHLNLSFNGTDIASTSSNENLVVLPESSFTVHSKATINIAQASKSLLPFIQKVISKQPVSLDLNGKINVRFLVINKEIEFNNEGVVYSENLLADIGAEKKVDGIKNTVNDILGKIGISL